MVVFTILVLARTFLLVDIVHIIKQYNEQKAPLKQSWLSFMTNVHQTVEITGACKKSIQTLMILFRL